jgi:hypothetical protein
MKFLQTVFVVFYHIFNALAQVSWACQGILGAIIEHKED